MTVERVAYSPKEAAEALGVSLATLYRLLQRGDLRYVTIGGPVRGRKLIARSALEELVRSKESA